MVGRLSFQQPESREKDEDSSMLRIEVLLELLQKALCFEND